MVFINYSWFELEANYGLFFYPNWEINYFYENQLFIFTTWLSNIAFLIDTNTRITYNFFSIYTFIDFITVYITNLLIIDGYFNYIILIDFYVFLNICTISLKYVFNGLDYIWIFIYSDVNFLIILIDYNYNNFTIHPFITTQYNIYNTYSTSFINLFINLIWFWSISSLFILTFLLGNVLFRNTFIEPSVNFNISRLYFYFYNLSKEVRINFELLIQFILFIIFIWIFNLMTFDDLNAEIVELFHLLLFYFFLFIIVYLLFKYSFHYFAFLESSVTEGKSSLFITKQFVRDISNTFALFLRFFLLLFRLNIYDGLDDFLDSYCLFFYDFDEDNADTSNLLNTSKTDFIVDNFQDLDISDKDNIVWFFDDFFKTYTLQLFEILYFIIFILEELFRLSLALYITYLIIFEVHTVNGSYVEDNYILMKRLK